MPYPRTARRRGRRDSAAANSAPAAVHRPTLPSRIRCQSRIDSRTSGASGLGRNFEGPATNLVALHADEQRTEIALSEAIVPLALDDFEKNRPDQGLSEDLRQISAIGAVEQDAAFLQIGDRLSMPRQPLLEHLVVAIRRRRHEFQSARMKVIPCPEDVVGAQRHVLNALAPILLDEFLDLIHLAAAVFELRFIDGNANLAARGA